MSPIGLPETSVKQGGLEAAQSISILLLLRSDVDLLICQSQFLRVLYWLARGNRGHFDCTLCSFCGYDGGAITDKGSS